MGRLALVVAGAVIVLLARGQAAVLGADTGVDAADASTAAPGPQNAMELLAGLPVQEPATTSGYDRDLFGSPWSDDVDVEGGHNGCDTRNDILRRDLDELIVEPGTHGCVAQAGVLADPYTGTVMPFERGQDSASRIHIAHVVALGNAWATGAGDLTAQQRRNFANDPLNLWAVNGSANQSQGDSDVAGWLPPHQGSWCDLVTTQLQVKAKYGLWVTPAEADTMRHVLSSCPS